MVIIQRDQPYKGINGYGEKDFEKGHAKGQQAVQDQSMMMKKSWVMMKDRTDNEHEE